MAITAEEIIAKRKDAGLPVQPRVDTLMATTPGLTGQLFTNNLLDSLGGSYRWLSDELERNDEAAVPTLAAVVAFLSTKDKSLRDDPGFKEGKKGARSAVEKFIDDFPKKLTKWKGYIIDEPTMGKKGWDTVYTLWKQAENDKMYQRIADARSNILEGYDAEGNFVPPTGLSPKNWGTLANWPASAIMGMFTPRRKAAFKEGRDPTAAETFMDIAQNAAYMVPVGAAEAAAARAVANPLASKIMGAAVGSAIAPVAVAAADYALGSKPYAGPGDAAIDAAIGTATNLGVGKVAAPILGQLANLGNVRGRVPQSVIDFLQGSKFERTKARDIISEAEQALKKHANETNVQYATKLRKGKTPDRLTDEQAIAYEDILAARDYAKNAEHRQDFADAWRQGMERDNYGNYRPIQDPSLPRNEWDDLLNVQRNKKTLDIMVDDALPGAKLGTDLSKGSYANYLENSGGRWEAQVARALKAHPELISLFDNRTLKQLLNDPELLFDMGRTWVVNKMGNDAAASRILSRYGVDVGNLRKWQDEARKERDVRVTAQTILDADERAEQRAIATINPSASSSFPGSASSTAEASQVISGENPVRLSPQSQKFLKQIAIDPSIMIYGHPDPEQAEEFKAWLLTEGHQLMSGTPAARPTWEIQ